MSLDGDEILKDSWFIDFIIYGEGEVSFKELIERIIAKEQSFLILKA